MKHIAFLFITCLAVGWLHAQSWQELYASTDNCWDKDWESCNEILQQARIAARTEFGEMDTAYILTVNDLGLTYQYMGQFDKALPLLKEALVKNKQVRGELASSYRISQVNVGMLYQAMGQFEPALHHIGESVRICKATLGTDNATYGELINNLALVYQSTEYYEKALDLYQNCLRLYEKHLGTKHPKYGIILMNIGTLQREMGKFHLALSFFQRANGIAEKSYPSATPMFLLTLGETYYQIGEFKKARNHFEQGISFIEQHLSKELPLYATLLTDLGKTYRALGDDHQAEQLFQQSLTLTERTQGKQAFIYATVLSHLGEINMKRNQYEKAQAHFQESLQLVEHIKDKQPLSYAANLHLLAMAELRLGHLSTALRLVEESQSYLTQTHGPLHLNFATLHASLAWIYEARDETVLAGEQYKALSKVLSHLLRQQFHALSDQLQASFLQTKELHFDQIASFLWHHPDQSQLTEIVYENQLLLKGFIQNNQKQLLSKLREHPDSSIQQTYSQWLDLRKILSRQYQQPLYARISTFDSLKTVAEQLALQLAYQSKDFRESQEKIDMRQIRESLSSDEIAIEFAHFSQFDGYQKIDSIQYIALIQNSTDSLPLMVPLFEQEELVNLLSTEGQDHIPDQLYASRGIKPRKNTPRTKGLADLIWKPIEPFLEGIKTVYYAPSGLLHRIHLEAIPIDKKQYIGTNRQWIRLGSTSSLVFGQDRLAKTYPSTALVIGDIQYDKPESSEELAVVDSDTATLIIGESGDLGDVLIVSRGRMDTWNPLAATTREIHHIRSLLMNSGLSVALYTRREAKESIFSDDFSSPRILHIATHGYFFPDPRQQTDSISGSAESGPSLQLSDHPMVRSGLILAGANHAWAGNPVPEGEEDGILTAYEISRLDLSNTELVVLSACETGLGDIQGNEGVYGLQRAFKIAGAKYILMSLWQVPDQATQELMSEFYEQWLGGMEIREALTEAQREIRKKYKEPYYWAGFVLVE
ncbi:MAG: CHAT domain-containing tetratricopeptide repeat protein [Bacteroidota bacterium]